MPKLKLFMWQLCHESFPTRGNLMKRGMSSIDPLCSLYQRETEDAKHLFLRCTVTH